MALNNLPGTKVEVNDGNLRITRPPVQPKVTLIGCTNNPNVDAGEPIRIESDDDAVLFDNRYDTDGTTLLSTGALQKPSELTRAIAEAFAGGAQNVEVIALPSTTGFESKLDPSPSASDRYDALALTYAVIKDTPMNIIAPVGAYIDEAGLLSSENFGYQLANFCYQNSINYQMCIGVLGVTPPNPLDTNPTGIPSLTQLEAWTAGLETFDTTAINGDDFTIFDGTTDAAGNGIPDNYAFWATSDEVIPVGGASAPRFDANVVTDRRGEPVDIGAYISVPTEWSRFYNNESNRVYPTLGYYTNSTASAYAGLISKLPARIGTTNQVIPGMTPIRQLSPGQADRLLVQRFVPMLMRSLGYVVVQDNTGAYKISDYYRSDFTLLTTVRIMHDAVGVVRTRAETYIGKPNNAVNRNALMSEIDEGLGLMQKRGALEWFEATIVATNAMRVLGRASIDLVIQPAYELLEITTYVSLTAGT